MSEFGPKSAPQKALQRVLGIQSDSQLPKPGQTPASCRQTINCSGLEIHCRPRC